MARNSTTTGTPLTRVYVPGPVERFGRTLKVEYPRNGLCLFDHWTFGFRRFPLLVRTNPSHFGGILPLLGTQEKDRGSSRWFPCCFAAVSLAHSPVVFSEWVVPYLLFGLTVFIMEGYRERRPSRIYALPAVFLGWSLADSSWWWDWCSPPCILHFPELKNRNSGGIFLICSSQGSCWALPGMPLLDRSILSALQFHPDGHVSLETRRKWRCWRP